MKQNSTHRSGTAVVYGIVAMTAILGMTSLAVDLSRVRVARTQLQCAADAASRYAVVGVTDGTYLTKAQAIAALSTVDNSTLSLTAADVVRGTWSGGTFTAGGSSPNAVQITAQCSAARGTAIPLLFGKAIGVSTCDVHASAVSTSTPGPIGGIVGLAGITTQNNGAVYGYYANTNPTPDNNSADHHGAVGSNASISAGDIYGDTYLGPSGDDSGSTVHGTSHRLTSAISTPTNPTWSPGTNPNSVAQSYSDSGGTTTLAGGTYWFTQFNVSGTVTFSGAAIVYINGPADITGSLTAYNNIPSNLKIYQYGSNTFGDSNGNNMTVIADIQSPAGDFEAKNNLDFYGRMIFNTINAKNNATFFYDEALGSPAGATIVSTVR